MSETWIEHKERSNPLALKLICMFAQNMPRRITRLWLWPITLYFFMFAPKARRASRKYLSRLPGNKTGLRDEFRHFHSFASVILDRVYFLTGKLDKYTIDIVTDRDIDAMLPRQQGAILLGAHMGSFEVMRCLAKRHAAIKLNIMMYQDHNAMITRVLDQLNPQIANSIINLADDDALLKAKEALEQGISIGMLGDRVLPNEKSVTCKLLGGEINLPAGPLNLAMIVGVPVIVFFGMYTGGNQYRMFLHDLYAGQIKPRSERPAVIAELMQTYAHMIEQKILAYPYNWFNFYDYWGRA